MPARGEGRCAMPDRTELARALRRPQAVQTVCGPLPVGQLGHCQMHEHIFLRKTPAALRNPALVMEDDAASVLELQQYRRAGGCAIVDAQPVGAGRDAEMLQGLSEASGVPIIAATGYHLFAFYQSDSPLLRPDEDVLYALYLSELTTGMLSYQGEYDHTRSAVCAGIVKAAIPRQGPVASYRTHLTAAARAAGRAGRPLMLHTEAGQNAVAAVELCLACGLAPGSVIVCHADRNASDLHMHEALAALGVYLDYDTIGRFRYHTDEAEATLILHMLERGYGDRLLLSLDTTAQRLEAYGGAIGLGYLLCSFYPRLAAAGVTGDVLSRLSTDNPRRVFLTAMEGGR